MIGKMNFNDKPKKDKCKEERMVQDIEEGRDERMSELIWKCNSTYKAQHNLNEWMRRQKDANIFLISTSQKYC